MRNKILTLASLLTLPLPLLLLGGCSTELLNPAGDIGTQEKHLILVASGLMLLVVIPVILLTLYFPWKYRAGNASATYSPKWAHSTKIEVVIWTIPCVIIVILAVLIWKSTHALDPYKPIQSDKAPLRVQVVAMNWKWLFIYPDYGVASVNQLTIPAGTPVEFTLTAESLMNSFFIPRLGSMVYAMAGMQTKLHLIADQAGTYNGMSAAYSGSGFSDMHFNAVAVNEGEFQRWVAQARRQPLKLDLPRYGQLTQQSNGYPVTVYGGVQEGLFNGIVNKYMHGEAEITAEMCRTPVVTTASKQ
jgi:cytochrome o ubiquinol oxidase subunit 2